MKAKALQEIKGQILYDLRTSNIKDLKTLFIDINDRVKYHNSNSLLKSNKISFEDALAEISNYITLIIKHVD